MSTKIPEGTSRPTNCLKSAVQVAFVYLLHRKSCECVESFAIVVVVSGMQLLRLRSAIRRHQGGSEPNLLLREEQVVLFQILLDGAEPRDAGTIQLSSPVCHLSSDVVEFNTLSAFKRTIKLSDFSDYYRQAFAKRSHAGIVFTQQSKNRFFAPTRCPVKREIWHRGANMGIQPQNCQNF